YAEKVKNALQEAGLRVEVDARNEKMNAKIRDFTLQKVPYVLVMGDKEEANEAVSVRTRGKGDQGSTPLNQFIQNAQQIVANKTADL
ncbi:MAG TPA: His/Gly/Thr/Pro-type tRNA ligase C-terminal domain-containing protein, partial [Acidobacteriaceae bacterium]|nr:His/Gly/Thr/Pro-type tRNA ligase C-terminal domain-containing protein [Acidobacteriaceae bacterium]